MSGPVDLPGRLAEETVDLLRHMIRNECVNDGTAESGHEVRNCDLLTGFLEGPGVDVQTWEPFPGRASLVARLEGTDPTAPKVCWMGHTDVVPVSPEGWSRDPFGAELVDGEVWGRGAVDMLNLTSSMAVAFRYLVRSGFRPRGDLIYFAVADEEAGGRRGAGWFSENEYDAIAADYVLTESGGLPIGAAEPPHLTLTVAEKGLAWRRLEIHGTPGHGSMPYRADNAVLKAAEVVRRLVDYRPAAYVNDMWKAQVGAMALDPEIKAALVDPARVWEGLERIEDSATAKRLHACTHTTFSPNLIQGGIKTNVIPDRVVLEVDIRTVPGDGPEEIDAHLHQALGDLADDVTVTAIHDDRYSCSDVTTPMWDTLAELATEAYEGVHLLPTMTTGGTDARFYRAHGAVAYGAGLFSRRCTYEHFANRFHGHDERIDVDSLALTTGLWLGVAERFWDRSGHAG